MTLLTQETIRAMRQWFADNAYLAAYTAWRLEAAAAALRGDYDHSLTFLQRATYTQTGDCPALLP